MKYISHYQRVLLCLWHFSEPFFFTKLCVSAVIVRCILQSSSSQCSVVQVFHSKATSKNKWKYLTADRFVSNECITHQISSNNRWPVIVIWFVSNRDFMPFKYQYNSLPLYVFQRLDLIFSTYKAGWFDKLSLMSNSFHCWRTLWGCCFFLCLFTVLIKTNWIELMVLSPRITVLPSQSCSSLKLDKSSVPCNQTWKKSTRQRSHLLCLLLLLWACYHISIKFTNNNLA